MDEPEIGLHPLAISKLAGMIRSESDRGCQIILSTQSPDLIGYFDMSSIIIVDKRNGVSEFKHLEKGNIEPWLQHYSLGELWKKGIL